MICYLTGMEPYYIQCIKDGPFQPKTAEAKDTWTDLVNSFEGPPDAKKNRIMDLKIEYNTFRAKPLKVSLRPIPVTRLCSIMTCISTAFFSNNIVQEFQENYDDDVDERTSEEYLKDLDIEFHERALLAGSKRFIKRRNNFSSRKANENTKCFKCAKLALLEAGPSITQSPKPFQSKNKGLVAETFDWDEEKVSDDEEMTQVKLLIALVDDELVVGKNHAINGEWIDIIMRKKHIKEPVWYLDSGCSRSMTSVKSYLHKYVKQPSRNHSIGFH
ncbi:hypothetical protein Tco_1218581 [Tanacetum coccineum]